MCVRLAKNINYVSMSFSNSLEEMRKTKQKFVSNTQDEMEKPKTKVQIPALAAGTSATGKLSKELTIKAIEAKLKSLEQQSDNLVINQTSESEIPLIQKYQFNKNNTGKSSSSSIGINKKYTRGGPYQRNQRRGRR